MDTTQHDYDLRLINVYLAVKKMDIDEREGLLNEIPPNYKLPSGNILNLTNYSDKKIINMRIASWLLNKSKLENKQLN